MGGVDDVMIHFWIHDRACVNTKWLRFTKSVKPPSNVVVDVEGNVDVALHDDEINSRSVMT